MTTFNERYQYTIDKYLNELKVCAAAYDGKVCTYTTHDDKLYTYGTRNGTSIMKRADWYQVPAQVTEFISATKLIIKLYSSPIIIESKIRCLCASNCINSPINCLDWMSLACCMYVNCNPQSEHYGKILISAQSYLEIVFQNIEELIACITEWIHVTDIPPVWNIDLFLDKCTRKNYHNHSCDGKCSRRYILQNSDKNSQLAHNILLHMTEKQQYAEPTIQCFTDYVLHTRFTRIKN